MSNEARPHPPRARKRIAVNIASLVVLAALAFGAFAYWFLSGDAPDEVEISSAVAELTTDTSATDTSGTNAPAASATDTSGTVAAATSTGIDGTWTVDTSVGEFSYEESTGTFVGFRVEEELSGLGSTTAVGRTPEVSGTVVIDSTSGTATLTSATIEADLTALTTNDSRRDDKALDALGTDEYPTATFVLLDPIELPTGAADGDTVSVTAHGELTIHGVAQTVDIALDAQLVGNTVVIVGSLDVVFADYGVAVPSSPIVVSAEDHGVIELQLFLSR
jgi:polyisoprenoid-binding protein YceI